MSNVAVFNPSKLPAFARTGELSDVAKALAGGGAGNAGKRISIKGGVFRLLSGGKEVAAIDERFLDVVIVKAAPKVARTFYMAKYDGETAAAPDCWSNDGDKPDAKSRNIQSDTCASCPQNVAGSGGGNRRACAFQRRIAVILADPNTGAVDPYGEVYQMNLASTTLFGKGEGNTHPFESYLNYLAANNESIDRIVTAISFDENETADVLKFTPVRHLTDEEIDVVEAAQATQEVKNIVQLTVAQQDGVKKLPPAAEAKVGSVAVEAEVEEPVKRASKKAEVPSAAPKAALADVVSAWSDA